MPLLYISAATGEGLDGMIRLVAEKLKDLPPMKIYEREYAPEDAYVGGGKETTIRRENDTFYVEGEWLFNLMGQINFSDYESLNFFQRVLQNSGVFTAPEEKGCRDGHTVSIYDFEFEYVK
jgi:GTP-binding protein